MEQANTQAYVTCDKCKWVHFKVSRQYALEEITRFRVYYNSLTPEEQQLYYGGKPSDLSLYDCCSRCGGSYKDTHDSLAEEVPYGSTIGPIIDRND